MGKNKKLISVLVVIIVLGGLSYFGWSSIRSNSLDIPKKSEINFIEIYADVDDISKYHVIEGEKNITPIYNALMSGKKNNNMESLSDTPSEFNGKLMKVVLNNSSDKDTILYVYKYSDGNYYIEKPYEGIYEITVKEYELLNQYFMAG